MKVQPAFDPLSPSFSDDPYKVYRQLRDTGNPFFLEENGMWMLSRFDDISAIATNPSMVRSLVGHRSAEEIAERQRQDNLHDMPYHERVVQFSLLDSDGDIHRRLRKQIFGAFTNTAVSPIEPIVQEYVDRLIGRLQAREKIDFISDFASHIPGLVIGRLLGAPEEDCIRLRLWSERIVQFFDIDRSDERKKIAEIASHEFYDYLLNLKNERKKSPRDDLISKMLVDDAKGLYSQDEFISTCMLVLMAGHGSTIDVLGSGMHILLKFPEVERRLRADIGVLPNAIQEMFRYEAPLPFFHRHATQAVTIAGQQFEAGTTFGLLYGSANRDPDHFENPDDFNMDRMPNRHLAFGQGAHLCLGNNLARLNMKVIFETLLRRFSSFELIDAKVNYKHGLSVRGPKVLNISWSPK